MANYEQMIKPQFKPRIGYKNHDQSKLIIQQSQTKVAATIISGQDEFNTLDELLLPKQKYTTVSCNCGRCCCWKRRQRKCNIHSYEFIGNNLASQNHNHSNSSTHSQAAIIMSNGTDSKQISTNHTIGSSLKRDVKTEISCSQNATTKSKVICSNNNRLKMKSIKSSSSSSLHSTLVQSILLSVLLALIAPKASIVVLAAQQNDPLLVSESQQNQQASSTTHLPGAPPFPAHSIELIPLNGSNQNYIGGEHALLAQLLQSTGSLNEANHLIDTLINDKTHSKRADYNQVRATLNSDQSDAGSMASDSQEAPIRVYMPAPLADSEIQLSKPSEISATDAKHKGLLDEIIEATANRGTGNSSANYNVHYDDEHHTHPSLPLLPISSDQAAELMRASKQIENLLNPPAPAMNQTSIQDEASSFSANRTTTRTNNNNSTGELNSAASSENSLKDEGLNNNESISSLIIRNPSRKLIANYSHLINHERPVSNGNRLINGRPSKLLHNQLILAENIRSRVADAIKIIEAPASMSTIAPQQTRMGNTNYAGDLNETASTRSQMADISVVTATMAATTSTTTSQPSNFRRAKTLNTSTSSPLKLKSSFDDPSLPLAPYADEEILPVSSHYHETTRVKPTSKLVIVGAINNLQDEADKMRLGKKNETGVHKIVFVNSMPQWTAARLNRTTSSTTTTMAPMIPTTTTETYVELSVFADTVKPTTKAMPTTTTTTQSAETTLDPNVFIEPYETSTSQKRPITSTTTTTTKRPSKRKSGKSSKKSVGKKTAKTTSSQETQQSSTSTTPKMTSTSVSEESSPSSMDSVDGQTMATDQPTVSASTRSAKSLNLAHLLLGTTSVLDRLPTTRSKQLLDGLYASPTESTPHYTSPFLLPTTSYSNSDDDFFTESATELPTTLQVEKATTTPRPKPRSIPKQVQQQQQQHQHQHQHQQNRPSNKKWQAVELPLHEHTSAPKSPASNQNRLFNNTRPKSQVAGKFVTFSRARNSNKTMNNDNRRSNLTTQSIRRSTVTTSTNSPLHLETTDYSQSQLVLPSTSSSFAPADTTQPIQLDLQTTTPGSTTTTTAAPKSTNRITGNVSVARVRSSIKQRNGQAGDHYDRLAKIGQGERSNRSRPAKQKVRLANESARNQAANHHRHLANQQVGDITSATPTKASYQQPPPPQQQQLKHSPIDQRVSFNGVGGGDYNGFAGNTNNSTSKNNDVLPVSVAAVISPSSVGLFGKRLVDGNNQESSNNNWTNSEHSFDTTIAMIGANHTLDGGQLNDDFPTTISNDYGNIISTEATLATIAPEIPMTTNTAIESKIGEQKDDSMSQRAPSDTHTTSYDDSSPSNFEPPSTFDSSTTKSVSIQSEPFIYQEPATNSPARRFESSTSSSGILDYDTTTHEQVQTTTPMPSSPMTTTTNAAPYITSTDLLPSILFHNRLSTLFQYKLANRTNMKPDGDAQTGANAYKSSTTPAYFQFEYQTRDPTTPRLSSSSDNSNSNVKVAFDSSDSAEMVNRLLKLNNGRPTHLGDIDDDSSKVNGEKLADDEKSIYEDKQLNLGYYGKFYNNQLAQQVNSSVSNQVAGKQSNGNNNGSSGNRTFRLSRREKVKPITLNGAKLKAMVGDIESETTTTTTSERQPISSGNENENENENRHSKDLVSDKSGNRLNAIQRASSSRQTTNNSIVELEENKFYSTLNRESSLVSRQQLQQQQRNFHSNGSVDTKEATLYATNQEQPVSGSVSNEATEIANNQDVAVDNLSVYIKPLDDSSTRRLRNNNSTSMANLTARKRRREPPVMPPTSFMEDPIIIMANKTEEAGPMLSIVGSQPPIIMASSAKYEPNSNSTFGLDQQPVISMVALGNLFARLPHSTLGPAADQSSVQVLSHPVTGTRMSSQDHQTISPMIDASKLSKLIESQQKRRRESSNRPLIVDDDSGDLTQIDPIVDHMLVDGSQNWRTSSLSPLVDEYRAKSLLKTMINLGVPSGNSTNENGRPSLNGGGILRGKPSELVRLVRIDKNNRSRLQDQQVSAPMQSETSTREAETSQVATSPMTTMSVKFSTTSTLAPPTTRKPQVSSELISSTTLASTSTTDSPTTTMITSTPTSSTKLSSNLSRWRSLGETQLKPLPLDKSLPRTQVTNPITIATTTQQSPRSISMTPTVQFSPVTELSNVKLLDSTSISSSQVPSFASLPDQSTTQKPPLTTTLSSPTKFRESSSSMANYSPSTIELITSSESPPVLTSPVTGNNHHLNIIAGNGNNPSTMQTYPASEGTTTSNSVRKLLTGAASESTESSMVNVDKTVQDTNQRIDTRSTKHTGGDTQSYPTLIALGHDTPQLRNQRFSPEIPKSLSSGVAQKNSTLIGAVLEEPRSVSSRLSNFQQVAIMTIGLCCTIIVVCLLVIAITIKCRSSFSANNQRPNQIMTNIERRRRDKRRVLAEARSRNRSVGGKLNRLEPFRQVTASNSSNKQLLLSTTNDLSTDGQVCSSAESTASICISTSSDGLNFLSNSNTQQQQRRPLTGSSAINQQSKPKSASEILSKAMNNQQQQFMANGSSQKKMNHILGTHMRHADNLVGSQNQYPNHEQQNNSGSTLRQRISGTITSRLLRLHLPRLLPYFALDYNQQNQHQQQQTYNSGANLHQVPSYTNSRLAPNSNKIDTPNLTLGDLLGISNNRSTSDHSSKNHHQGSNILSRSGMAPSQLAMGNQSTNFHLRAAGCDKLQRYNQIPLPKAKRNLTASLEAKRAEQKRRVGSPTNNSNINGAKTSCNCASCSSSWLFNSQNNQGNHNSAGNQCLNGHYNPVSSRGKLPFGTASSVLRQSGSASATATTNCQLNNSHLAELSTAGPRNRMGAVGTAYPASAAALRAAMHSGRHRLMSDCMTSNTADNVSIQQSQVDNEHHLLITEGHQMRPAASKASLNYDHSHVNQESAEEKGSAAALRYGEQVAGNGNHQTSDYNITGTHFSRRPDLCEPHPFPGSNGVDQVHQRHIIEEEIGVDDEGNVDRDVDCGVSVESDNYYNLTSQQTNYDAHPTFQVDDQQRDQTGGGCHRNHVINTTTKTTTNSTDQPQPRTQRHPRNTADGNGQSSSCNCNLILYPL